MTVRIIAGAPNREMGNAELFQKALLDSEPCLKHPDITLDILCSLPLPGRQLDIVVLYQDSRPVDRRLRTSRGAPVHSFVLVLEIKQHSPDLISFKGPTTLVKYNQKWRDATDQCDAQMWALKRYQQTPYEGRQHRQTSYVQRAIWLARAPRKAFADILPDTSVPVHFAELGWQALIDRFALNGKEVRTLVDQPDHKEYHSLESPRAHLTYPVRPTRLDLRRVDALTQTRFDVDKTAYIQNLGTGLLVLCGRGGTGKTFALVQIALHLARQGKRTVLLTYKHGLIADLDRALRIIREKDAAADPPPQLMTRYAFIQEVFKQTFGLGAEKRVVEAFSDIGDREDHRLTTLMDRPEVVTCDFDFVLVDECQDWTDAQRDFLYRLFGPEHVVVADGVDQFVGQDRCIWDHSDVPINRRHRLRASRRTKGATCQTVAEIARDLGLSDWDLEPDPKTHGGRFTIMVEPDPVRAVARGLDLLASDQRDGKDIRAVDNLVCMPSEKMAKGINYAGLFDLAVEAAARDSWRGFDQAHRLIYPSGQTQLRAVQYHSCRGMEGWTTLCLGLDGFYEFQSQNARLDVERLEISLRDREGLLYSARHLEEALMSQTHRFAVNWLMIPLTRSIDHLIVHLADEHSELGQMLSRVSQRFPGAIEWLSPP
jgi:hypothetical protein